MQRVVIIVTVIIACYAIFNLLPVAETRVYRFILIPGTNHLIKQLNYNVLLLMPLNAFVLGCNDERGRDEKKSISSGTLAQNQNAYI